MNREILPYYVLLMGGVFVGAISQVILKKSALRKYDSPIKEYLNPAVIIAYFLFFTTTFLSTVAYRRIPLSMGPVIETTGYIYVTVFGIKIFHEKFNLKKGIALALIVVGVIISLS